jgi:hypothetical protein
MISLKNTIPLLSLFVMAGCVDKTPTYSTMGNATQTPGIEQIVNKNGNLTLQMKGNAYYGNLVLDSSKRFELNPLIKGVTGNAKGVLVASTGKVVTCVMELQEETISGSGYCLEDDNPKLLKIHLVTMQK